MTSPMQIVRTRTELEQALAPLRGQPFGFVPTMGALHAGHLSLMGAARDEVGRVVVSIFVNPLQFSPGEDFERYPRPLAEDLEQCRAAGVDVVFVPGREVLYPKGEVTRVVQEGGPISLLEGAHRPDHFVGVLTVVAKLLGLVWPTAAYFGQKDFQQWVLVRRMVTDLCWPMDIRRCPIVREPDGLALSSRNRYLMGEQRTRARALVQALHAAAGRFAEGESSAAALEDTMAEQLTNLEVDYAVCRKAETLEPEARAVAGCILLVAARVGDTRLIDNHILGEPMPGPTPLTSP